MLSIVDPEARTGGAWTVTRALLDLLRNGPLRADVDVVAVPPLAPLAHRYKQVLAAATSLISGLPSKVEFTRSRSFLARVRNLLRHPFDLTIVNGTDLAWILPHLPAAMKRVLIAHNIEHQLFASQVRKFSGAGLFRKLLQRDLHKLRLFEIESLSCAGNVIFLSSTDAACAHRHCPKLRSLVVPPLFADTPIARRNGTKSAESDLHLGMLANFGWWPNREALAWFVEKVFPHAPPEIQLHLFGAHSDTAAPLHPRIHRHGYIADLSTVWNTCDIMICPVFSGGGVCVKVAESIYHGMPLLASRFSTRGLPLHPDPSIVLLDTPEDWIGILHSGARELARQIVPRPVADQFATATHSDALSEFLSRAV